tara:strand:- start:6388 stop:6624 length:237 start_codon:yes stop_codon:yes gene_type:complete
VTGKNETKGESAEIDRTPRMRQLFALFATKEAPSAAEENFPGAPEGGAARRAKNQRAPAQPALGAIAQSHSVTKWNCE